VLRQAFPFLCIILMVATLTGCFGLMTVSPVECPNETPYPAVHDLFQTAPREKGEVLPPKNATKTEFLDAWGQPDEIVKTSETSETWIYKRKLWCGVVPMFIVPLPLVYRGCEGFDHIYFEGDRAKLLHTKHTTSGGFALILTPVGGNAIAGSDPACKYPIPFEIDEKKKATIEYKDQTTKEPTYVKEEDSTKDNGIVILYRPKKFLGSGGVHHVIINKKLIIPLYDGSYYRYETIGENEFINRDAFFYELMIKMAIKSGEKRYIRYELGIFTVSFEEVPADIAEREITGLREVKPPFRK